MHLFVCENKINCNNFIFGKLINFTEGKMNSFNFCLHWFKNNCKVFKYLESENQLSAIHHLALHILFMISIYCNRSLLQTENVFIKGHSMKQNSKWRTQCLG